MGNEYRATVFKADGKVVVSLPGEWASLEGAEVVVREERGELIVRRLTNQSEDLIDLTGIYGSVPRSRPPPFDDNPLDWHAAIRRG